MGGIAVSAVKILNDLKKNQANRMHRTTVERE